MDALADGRPFRILTVVDQWSRSSPFLEVASRMSGDAVGEALDRVLAAALRARLPSITAPSSSREHSMTGPIATACRSISFGAGNPLNTHSLKPSTGDYGRMFERGAGRPGSRRIGEDRSVARRRQSATARSAI